MVQPKLNCIEKLRKYNETQTHMYTSQYNGEGKPAGSMKSYNTKKTQVIVLHTVKRVQLVMVNYSVRECKVGGG